MIKTGLLAGIAATVPVFAIVGAEIEDQFLQTGVVGAAAVVEFVVIVVLWRKLNERIDRSEGRMEDITELHRVSLEKNTDALHALSLQMQAARRPD